jgi:hypothetical protein
LTFFDYISVAVSIVLALSIARIVDGLRVSFDPNRRYWVHATWVVIKLFNPVIYWWSFWAMREVTWNLLMFTLVLAWPVGLYLQVSSLVTRDPESISDWRLHFYSQRQWFFGANALLNILSLVSGFAVGATNPPQVSAALVLLVVLSVVAIATDRPVVHGIIVVCMAVITVLAFVVRAYAPVPLIV